MQTLFEDFQPPVDLAIVLPKAKAEELSSASTMAYLGTEFARKEDRIYECARLLLQMGDYK